MPQVTNHASTENQELQNVESKVQVRGQVLPAQTTPPLNYSGFLHIVCFVILGSLFAQTTLRYFTLDVAQDREEIEIISVCMKFAVAASLEWIRWVAVWLLEIDMFYVQSVATCGALSWLLYRAWLTLWKPVPDLISILGVEVPDAPSVSLAGIRADAVTIAWPRPETSRPVQKYYIQVNGVNVGETPRQDTAITVKGLKPAHFYNIRVIAVGTNNFQAGSAVIRVRTYGRDGRPILENGRIPNNFSYDDSPAALEDSSDESPAVRGLSAGIEAASIPDNLAPTSKGRRNTVGRRRSPSSANDPAAVSAARKHKEPEESMSQLSQKFESIRDETDEIVSQMAKDLEETKLQQLDLEKERDEKRIMLKEKEDAAEKLRKDINSAESRNRTAQTRKNQKEKILQDKEATKTKMIDDMGRWRKEIEQMNLEKETWSEERETLEKEQQSETEKLQSEIRERQNSLNGLEEEIKVKGLQIKELEEARKSLPGAEDEEETSRQDAEQIQLDSAWDLKERDLNQTLTNQSLVLRGIQYDLAHRERILAAYTQRHANNPFMHHGNSSGVDFDPTGGQAKPKSRRSRNRKSRTNTVSSPATGYSIDDSNFSGASGYNNMNSMSSPFAAGPYFDLSQDIGMAPASDSMSGMSDADIRALTAGAPLSPTATSLLPSNIFLDDDLPPIGGVFGPPKLPSSENDPQSPGSSSRSASLLSSPRDSSQNLAMYGVSSRDYPGDFDRRSRNSPKTDFGVIGSPTVPEHTTTNKGFGNLGNFFRPRGKTIQDGPALGTLKQGQSQSFPRSTEEPDTTVNRPRRISFSNFLSRATAGESSEGNAPAPLRNIGARSRRGFNLFNRSVDEDTTIDRNPGSPGRPLSVASFDLPRPSSDSAPFGWGPAAEGTLNRNSPLATNWSINAPYQSSQAWSRSASRRPSIQHGSTTALTTGIVSEEDEFLPDNQPPTAGVIGTRPQSSQKHITPKLNPAAPAFERTTPQTTPSLPFSTPVTERATPGFKNMFSSFTSKSEKEKAKVKAKGKEKSDSPEEARPTTSPSLSRMSRDTPSLRTQSSIADSYDSLSLEPTSSNTPSDANTPTGASTSKDKDKETAFRKLFRKGSSSMFTTAGMNSSLFSSKKPSSSTMNSDRNASERESLDEYGEESNFGKGLESVTSSPMIGSLGSGDSKGKELARSAPREGRMSVNWGRFGIKGKNRESSDVDRSDAGTGDESNN